MIRRSFPLITILIFLCQPLFAAKEARFMQFPDVRGTTIVFTYQGDLWKSDVAGGTATRLTSAPGNEYASKISPDGKTIAFTANYDGTVNAYTIPIDGGEPKRLTYLPASVQTIGWTPDGKRIIVRSYYENFIGRDPNLYFFDKDGSAPERFPIDRARLCSFSSDGTKMLYQRRGDEEYNRKRYYGGQYPDIWMYDFTSKAFTPITKYVGKNAYPMWIGGSMYYVSDQTNTISNLHKYDLSTATITPVTTYDDVDVIAPSTDGENIVFLHDGYIHLYNIAAASAKKLSIQVATDDWAMRTRTINPTNYIHWMSVSNDGATAVFEARGDVFAGPVDKSTFKNLSNTPGTRESYPQISPDGKWIAFFSDKSGEYQLYTQPVTGGEWTPLTTTLDRTAYHILWSPDGKKILFGNKDFSIFVVEVGSKKLKKIDSSNQMKNDEFFWEVSDYNWSPDSKWICYSFVQYNKNSQIFIYNLESGKRYPVTDDFFDNLNPCFDANGEYLYYLSSRNFDQQMDFYEDNHVESTPQNVVVVALREKERPPFADTSSGPKSKGGPFRIDLNGIMQRATPIPGLAGNFFFLKAGKGKVMWSSVDRFTEGEYGEIYKPGGATKWQLHVYDMNERKDNILSDKIKNVQLSPNQENMIIQAGSDYFVTTPDKAYSSKSTGTKIQLGNMIYTVDSRKEWLQIFDDTWRWYREFYYDENMVGKDWKAMRERYRAYVSQISSRDELNWVMLQLVGELATSHTYISGGDFGPASAPSSPIYTGWLGVDLIADKASGCYKIQTIFAPTQYNASAVSPLARPDIAVKEGDFLIAIDGKEIHVPDDYNKYLQVADGQKVKVTISSTPFASGAKTYEIELIRNNTSLRYFRWLSNNINTVLKKSDGKLGYMHINAMGGGGVGEFDKFWRAFRYKEGIIIDVRRNGGGWTEYFMIDKLERQTVALNTLRNMVPFRYPGSTATGNYVVISNENNGSDGEAFVEHFKARKLGTVVGVPSWGGLVGILNTQQTIDNGSVEQSNNAFYTADGKWLVENHGADPDIVLDNDPASVMAGKDVQLDKAIDVALQQIKDHPFKFPPVPKYPVR